ncbi:MAG TPA: DUF475 domain-containing protein [Nocardioides sp.]|nr:DUF475 domain-containing protein [Nocardioides sp.]
MFFKTFGWALGVTVIALVGAFVLGGPSALALVAILSILEISLSFDNAVVNATILERMNPAWQKLFLTVGILIAVFGMRLLFPLVIVGITAHLNPVEVVHKALEGGSIHEAGTYANLLHGAHPAIAAFGGMFLLLLFLDFVLEEREIAWLAWLERPLARIGKLDQLAVVLGLGILVIAAKAFGHTETVLISGVLGALSYLLVGGLGDLFEEAGEDDEESAGGNVVLAAGKAAFFLFLYLEVLDASFSFDGVIGAFAITQDIFIIATGLGVGAMYIRSLTVYLVRKGTLSEYIYLEHGAMWAIGALATILLISIKHEVPEVVTGLVGVGFIGLAFMSSLIAKRNADEDDNEPEPEPVTV